MFGCKACMAKDREIERLSSMVQDLQNRLMSFVPMAMEIYTYAKNQVEPSTQTVGMMGLGRIESMNADTEEEQKQKEAAKSQFMDIIGH